MFSVIVLDEIILNMDFDKINTVEDGVKCTKSKYKGMVHDKGFVVVVGYFLWKFE